MVVSPADCFLENLVEFVEINIAGDLNPSPDGRLYVPERYLELVDGIIERLS